MKIKIKFGRFLLVITRTLPISFTTHRGYQDINYVADPASLNDKSNWTCCTEILNVQNSNISVPLHVVPNCRHVSQTYEDFNNTDITFSQKSGTSDQSSFFSNLQTALQTIHSFTEALFSAVAIMWIFQRPDPSVRSQ